MTPSVRPGNPNFSSGPCSKRPGWSLEHLKEAVLGRSHRSQPGKERLREVLDRTRGLLDLPDDYHVAIVPGSDTGAMEMAIWSLIGARGVDVLAWENFGLAWVTDIVKQLKLDDIRCFEAAYGELPDLALVDCDRDVVFTWNGTTSGVCVPDGEWIADNRAGLTICDATSAVLAMALPWEKLDAITFSWQKVLGGEAGHGMLILSPRAVARLESHQPLWPLPKVFRLTKGGKFNAGIFAGETINTPSMMCVEDALDALRWAESIGGSPAMIEKSKANLARLTTWVGETGWIDFLSADAATRSNTSVCLKIVDPSFLKLDDERRWQVIRAMVARLEAEGVAYDINGHREAPPGLRIWCGATVEADDLEALTPWLDWAFDATKADLALTA